MKEAEKGREDWSSLVVAVTGSVTFQSPRGDGDEKAFDGGIMGVVRKRLKGMGYNG